MNLLVSLFLLFVFLKTAAELGLEWLNRQEVLKHQGQLPEAFKTVMDDKTFDKATAYTLEQNRFGLLETIFDAVILAVVLAGGVLSAFYYGLTDLLGRGIWGQALVMYLLLTLLSLPGIPLEWWSTFKIEAKYGFNKTTLKIWITDKIKGVFLGLVLALPLVALLLWFFKIAPNTWWLWGFLALFSFQLLMLVLYPRLIVPLFNKLTPLPEGELRDRLLALGERTGFTAATIQVIDGSKRSTHSNAYFTGFGKFRRIVLYDTLIEQLEDVELEAVLAHEIGHYKRGHIPKMLVISALSSLIGFGLIGWVAGQSWFFESFGFSVEDGMVPAIMLFTMLSGLLTFWLTPLMNLRSRKHEYEADAFAREAMDGDPEPLVSSLRKMYEKNLSNLTPHPLYSGFHYSHPTLLEREGALRSGAAKASG